MRETRNQIKMSDSIKESDSQTEVAPVQKPAKKSHFKRFWWVYLLVLLVVATVVVVPVV
jgi:hypothetical protein